MVELTLPDGSSGIGESAPVSRYNESAPTVEAFLRQIDPSRISTRNLEEAAAYLDSIAAGNLSAKCAVNLALLDLAAKQARKPVHDFLGLKFHEQTHVTSFTIGMDSPEVIQSKVIDAERFEIIKMKMGSAQDAANLQALRTVAPHKRVRVDANEGWATKEEALEKIEWLAGDGKIDFVEQPMPASRPVTDWAWLKERSPLPIFGDESYHSAEDATQAAECFHGINVKLVKTGGIIGAKKALEAASQQGLKTMLGCMIETSVLITAGAHLATLCDHLDLDGNLLISNDPYEGVTAKDGILSFAQAPEPFGLRVGTR